MGSVSPRSPGSTPSLAAVARDLGLPDEALVPYGRDVAKVHLASLPPLHRRGKLVLVTAMTPTPHGEGKTVTSIGLAQGLHRVGTRTIVTLRQPSLGPLFGRKGGATGGGCSRVEPAERIDLHFTGDMHAVTAAQNLVVALADNHVHQGNALGIDPDRIVLPRCLDVDDRQLRRIRSGLAAGKAGPVREEAFVITAATETMAVLSVASDLADLRDRLGRMLVAWTHDGGPVTVDELGGRGAATLLLRDALDPNLVLTTEGVPALVHGGPFANVAHGTNSVVATRLALSLADVVVAEAGFGSDLGAEKFVDLVGVPHDLRPDAAVLVATLRALRWHGEAADADDEGDALTRGLANLDHHVGILRTLGVPPVVALNRFPGDDDAELDRVLAHCRALGVPAAVHTAFADGGAGAETLAKRLLHLLDAADAEPRPPYDAHASLREKIAAIATRIYGADGVAYDGAADASIARLEAAGLDHLPPCMAKTPLSLSDDGHRRNVPRGWTLRVHDVEARAGAGFVVVRCGDILLMPGLGAEPAALAMDVAPDGAPVGFEP